MEILVEAAGWIGAVLILGAYFLVTTGRVTGRSVVFQWMNLVGAAGFVVNTLWHGAIPSAVVNVIWMGIALVALLRLSTRRRQEAR